MNKKAYYVMDFTPHFYFKMFANLSMSDFDYEIMKKVKIERDLNFWARYMAKLPENLLTNGKICYQYTKDKSRLKFYRSFHPYLKILILKYKESTGNNPYVDFLKDDQLKLELNKYRVLYDNTIDALSLLLSTLKNFTDFHPMCRKLKLLEDTILILRKRLYSFDD